jgi:hypothetical protein
MRGLMPRQSTYSENPYLLISKKDGSNNHIPDIKLPVRYNTNIVMGERNGAIAINVFMPPNIIYYGQDFVITDISSDTIYKIIRKSELTPFLIRTPSVHLSDPLTVWSSMLTTDKFTVLLKATKDEINKTFIKDTLIHDYNTGETNKVTFVNDDYPSVKWSHFVDAQILQKNVAASLLQLPSLYEAYERKQLKGNLEKLVATLDEDDNPIVMIVEFK